MPVGLGGAGGTAPAAMRSVQLANAAVARGPSRMKLPLIPPPYCPDLVRRSHAASVDSNVPRLLGISRVALVPVT